jgi:hypothetical protein
LKLGARLQVAEERGCRFSARYFLGRVELAAGQAHNVQANNDGSLAFIRHLARIGEGDIEDVIVVGQGIIAQRTYDQLGHVIAGYFALRIEGAVAQIDQVLLKRALHVSEIAGIHTNGRCCGPAPAS